MSEKFGNYIERRAAEEGVDIPEHKENLDYVEGRKKLDFRRQFSSGEFLEATEDNGDAQFSLVRNGKKIFDFGRLATGVCRFVTPDGWSKLSEQAKSGEYNQAVPDDFVKNPEDYKKMVQGKWMFNGRFISVGEVNSLKDIFALLHEIGHARTIKDYDPQMSEAERRWDTEKIIEISSEAERAAWAEAIRVAREIKNDLGVDLFEGFSSPDDLKKYIYSRLSVQRYGAEVSLSSVPTTFLKRIVFDVLGVDPKTKKSKWLDDLFDKRQLLKK